MVNLTSETTAFLAFFFVLNGVECDISEVDIGAYFPITNAVSSN